MMAYHDKSSGPFEDKKIHACAEEIATLGFIKTSNESASLKVHVTLY